ncbi:DUF397 domain-containing protein [Streptomyces sp. NPDC056244]|uniref:DUF397 domain-containing protein n=1 Tax=unclassified Streptomyces TaxID=2593676 RepID=UPI0035E2E5D8
MSAYLAQPPVQTPSSTPRTSPTPSTASPACPASPLPPLAADAVWRRSSRSTGANNCVESARTAADVLAVRDSKNVTRPHLSFSAAAWTSFVSALREESFTH